MTSTADAVRLRSATAEDAPVLTQLIFRAKAYWGYPAEWMDAWCEDLTITPEYIGRHRVILAEAQQQPAAFHHRHAGPMASISGRRQASRIA